MLTTTSGTHGVELFQKYRPTATVLDLRLPDLDGIDVLKELRKLIRPRRSLFSPAPRATTSSPRPGP
ncbi:MAG: hypothetical protein ABI945_07340 [Nitrospirales bacterium]